MPAPESSTPEQQLDAQSIRGPAAAIGPTLGQGEASGHPVGEQLGSSTSNIGSRNPDDRPALIARTSNSSLSSSSGQSPSPTASPLSSSLVQAARTSPPAVPISPSRRLPSAFVPSSPLSSASTRGRGRQSSTSSTMSTATNSTEPTSLDEADEDSLGDNSPTGSQDATGTGTAGVTPKPRLAPSASSLEFYSSQATTPTHAISIPPTSGGALPISISTAIPPASVRLSTTPHFPSPLAQASGPEEDVDHGKGEESPEDDDEPPEGDTLLANDSHEGSLSREGSAPLFGELDFSPTLSTVALPDNSLGLEAARTPRPLPRSGHRRNLSGRDSSPEVDKTARAIRVRSVGRASQRGSSSSLGLGSSPTETALARRRSRTSDAGLFPPTSPPGSPGATPRSIPPLLASSLGPTSSPPSPIAAPANSITRRTSINLVSPPRPFAPSSPTISRAPRSSLSAQLASPVPPPFPAPPPPTESIKLNKVPESVRSATDFRTPTGASYLGEAISLPQNQSLFGIASGDVKVPKTPAATRAPSPASGSGSTSLATSENGRSKPPSQTSSRGPSRGPSRRASQEVIPPMPPIPATLTAPIPQVPFVPGHLSSSSASSSSAFSPLFPFPIPSSPSIGTTRQSRSKSVLQPPRLDMANTRAQLDPSSSSSSGSSPVLSRKAGHDLGVSPLTTGISPLALGFAGTPAQRAVSGTEGSSSRSTARGLLTATNRTSIIPSGADNIGGSNTDEYAQIIMASRTAKMRKWKTSGSSIGSLGFDAMLSRVASEQNSRVRKRRGIPSFGGGEEDEDGDEEDEEDEEPGQVSKEIEWVDWLDEYRKMKEAKLRAEQDAAAVSTTQTPAAVADEKGKGKEIMVSDEYNPFEAATADVNTRRTTGFLTPNPPVNYFPLTATATSPTSTTFQPKTTSHPTADFPDSSGASLSRSNSKNESNSNLSPTQKRKKNFKLGTKIDAWWSAVRTSFSTGSEDERSQAGSSLGRRTSDTPANPSPPAPSRTSSQFTRPSAPPPPVLRNAASAQDLSQSKPRVPAGALAPAARVDGLLAPRLVSRPSSGSDESDGATTTKVDSRWRNPHLSLNLGPSFSTLPEKSARRLAPVTDSSDTSAATSSHFFSPPLPDSSVSAAPPSRAMKHPPSHPPIWDRTPALVQTSTIQERGMTAMAKPQAIQEAKAGVDANFSMHTVRAQIRLRLQTAKESCDKELKKIVHGITADVEVELHGTETHNMVPSGVPAGGFDEGQFGDLVGDVDGPYGPYQTYDVDSESEALADTDDAVHTDSDGATSRPPSRTHGEGLRQSRSTGNRRQSMTAWKRTDSPRRQSLAPLNKRRTGAFADFGTYSMGERPAKSGSGSAASSRSNSRSRSPLPPRKVSVTSSPAQSSNSHLPLQADSQSPLIVLLQEIITVATEILDTPISKLTARPGCCAEYIQRVQTIGQAWDDDPELASRRGWYVQLLLAVAGLSRVVEWWEAERGFWTFDDGDEEDAEPILFVAKPTDGDTTLEDIRSPGQSFPPAPETENKSSPTSQITKYSPLGIDLGGDAPEEPRTFEDLPHTSPAVTEEAVKQHAEDLRQAVEEVRSQTLLMELSLDGQLFQFLSSAWEELVGIPGDECLDTPISDFLYPDDAAVFAEATRQLEADDSHTVEVNFRLRVASSSETSQDEEPPEDFYEVMEGKGMLMADSLSGRPSHTMWVIRPAPLAPEAPSHQRDHTGSMEGFHRRTASDPVMPFSATAANFSTESILCRICERPTPAWFFEKHNETCNETHRLESDINECNDRLKDLSRTITDISATLDSGDAIEGPEYRGIPFLQPKPATTPPTYLEGLRPPLGPKPASFQLRKGQHRILDQVGDIVQTALGISTPTVLDEAGDVPIQDQRLLSPNSENKLAMVMRWQRPTAEEPALIRLITDAEEQTRFKLNSVNRLRNTILYAEKVRHEWEAKANHALAAVAESHWESSSGSSFASPLLQPMPAKGSPKLLDPLELPRDGRQHLRRQSSLFGLLSPLQAPDDSGQFGSPGGPGMALSPRIPSGVPSSRTKASSIKDFAILKPISKGAFGSVYLVKKKTTGDYYAIKVLKKSDMIAKNQVTNVKAERMILMTQTESDFVVKLFYTFQSKDYLYLVMEYLNGGDCAALVKNMGELPEDWARKYIAEVVVGLEYLHASGIVHRDLKPDNLLIDAKGHLKLTDFGLSRIGLLGRQTRMPVGREHRRPFDNTHRSDSKDPDLSNTSSPSSTPANAIGASQASYFGSVAVTDNFWLDTPNSESSSSASASLSKNVLTGASEKLSSAARISDPAGVSRPSPTARNFVGTPDYLAPESILGIGMDAGVDWWALGVICYEFLYGIPPFHDETPEKVFENILSRRIEWHEEIEISAEARDFMERLLCSNASRRLGKGGASEVKAHPFLADIDWANLLSGEVDFVPKVHDPESTDYFDPRGATDGIFADVDGHEDHTAEQRHSPPPTATTRPHSSSDPLLSEDAPRRAPRERSETEPSPHEDFGTFNFRNLPVLKQANDDVIRQMREQMLPPHAVLPEMPRPPLGPLKPRPGSTDFRQPMVAIPSLPSSPSATSSSSNPSRPSAPSTPYSLTSSHSRRPSEQPAAAARPRQASVGTIVQMSEHARRNSLPSRLRRASLSEYERPPIPDGWASRQERRRTSAASSLSSPAETVESMPSLSIPPHPPLTETTSAPPLVIPPRMDDVVRPRTIDCLVAGRNPISNKVLETMLVRLGTRVVVVPNGAEAILAAQGVKFDVIWMDLQMPIIDGEKAARMIKSTNNPSSDCFIVAVTSYSTGIDEEVGTLFSAVLPKPILRDQLMSVFKKLGFQQQTRRGSADRRASEDASGDTRRDVASSAVPEDATAPISL